MPTATCRRCPDGPHETEAIRCPHCQTAAYEIVLHEYPHGEGGHYHYAVQPVNGSPPWTGEPHPTCRDCGSELVRR